MIPSPVLIPTTESKVITLVPLVCSAITVLMLVTSPRWKMASFNVDVVELTVVVVPSTCKLPLMMTLPSLLNPSGYGSMKSSLLPGVVEITLSSILTYQRKTKPFTSNGLSVPFPWSTSYLHYISAILIIFNLTILIITEMRKSVIRNDNFSRTMRI